MRCDVPMHDVLHHRPSTTALRRFRTCNSSIDPPIATMSSQTETLSLPLGPSILLRRLGELEIASDDEKVSWDVPRTDSMLLLRGSTLSPLTCSSQLPCASSYTEGAKCMVLRVPLRFPTSSGAPCTWTYISDQCKGAPWWHQRRSPTWSPRKSSIKRDRQMAVILSENVNDEARKAREDGGGVKLTLERNMASQAKWLVPVSAPKSSSEMSIWCMKELRHTCPT